MRRFATAGLSVLAAAAALGATVPAAAQPYGYYSDRDPCHDQQHNSGTAGALLGGAAGAAIGNGVSRGGGRLGGTVIGGVAGAVIGNNIARSQARGSDACRYQQRGYYAPPPTYYNGGYDGRYGYNNYAPAPRYYGQPYGDGYYGRSYDDDDGD